MSDADSGDAARRLTTEAGDTLVSAVRRAGWNDLSLGDELASGRFAIERLLGRGGMGVVYAARDLARNSSVAIKTLDVHEAAALHGIKREFRALSDIYHPNLVRLHELFVQEDRCFFTMDLIDGVDFLTYVQKDEQPPQKQQDLDPTSRVLDRDHTPWRRSRRVESPKFDLAKLRPALEQLVGAVHALHSAGKLHRDLKPSNVLVTDSGQLVILDFGLAFDHFRESASEQIFGGTPFYMAPELLTGGAASPSSDWYAVGVMLYEALTGRDPFFGIGADLLWEKREHEPLWPSEFARDVPGELEVLCMRLLKRRPEERASAEEILAALGVAPRHSASEERRGPAALLGRAGQLGTLRAAFEKTKTTQRPLVTFLAGLSGLGKTWLLEHFADELRGEATVLLGRCHEREWVPHKAFDQVVDGLARELRELEPSLLESLPAEQAQAIAGVFPVLQQLHPSFTPEDPELVQTNPREIRRRAYAALRRLLCILSKQRPLVVAIDDLHWGDADSARLFSELFGADDAPHCLLIATYRDDEAQASACLKRLLGNERPLSDLVETWRIALDELDDEQSRALASSLLGLEGSDAPDVVAAICEEAHGNPLLIRELVSHVGASSGPREKFGLSDVVRARLSRLSAGERLLFELVCVAGSPLSQAVISSAAGVAGTISGQVLRLQSERLVRDRTSLRPDAIDVFHDRIRTATLSELDPEDIRRRHLALALAHERLGAREPEALARHYAGAGNTQQAASWAERAADASTKLLALNRAAELYRMAYELGDDPERKAGLRVRLAVALSDAGRGGEAAPLFLQAAASAPVREALELRRRAAEQFLVSGHTDRGLEALRGVLQAVDLELPRSPRAALFDLVLTRTRLGLRGLGFTPRNEADIDPKQLLRVDACKASWALSFINTIQGAAFQARFLHAALTSGEPSRIALGLGMEAIYTSTEGGFREARVRELQQAARELSKKLSDPHVEAFDAMVEGQTGYMFGRWATAVKSLERAERILVERCRNVTWELNSSRFFWANALTYFGRWRELSRRLQTWQEDAMDRGDLYAESAMRLIEPRSVTLADDDPERAQAQIDQALGLWRSNEFGVQRFLAELSRVQIALYENQASRAVSLMKRMWPEFSNSLMSRIQLCRIHASHHAAFSCLALAAESNDRSLLRKATTYANKLDREAMPWARAFATFVRAAVFRLRGDPERAVQRLREAAESFEACQMHFYGAAASTQLGRMLGGEEGAALVHSGVDRFRAQGVLRPERIVAMMAPGFSEA